MRKIISESSRSTSTRSILPSPQHITRESLYQTFVLFFSLSRADTCGTANWQWPSISQLDCRLIDKSRARVSPSPRAAAAAAAMHQNLRPILLSPAAGSSHGTARYRVARAGRAINFISAACVCVVQRGNQFGRCHPLFSLATYVQRTRVDSAGRKKED